MDRKLIWVMAIASCVVVSNIYYSQPLLREIRLYFHLSEQTAGLLTVITQAGYALGLLFAVPLSDMLERKRLIIFCIIMAGVMLVVVASAPNFSILCIASCLMGFFSMVPQMLIPFAANLAGDAERGRIVGTVMSGLLIGILLSRTLAGFVGAFFGWRMIYWIAAVLMIIIAFILRSLLPLSKGSYNGSYVALMRSILDLVGEYPELRSSALIGACLFAALNLFWTNLSFLLATPPYHYGADTVGLFGLLGAGGALAAPLFGKLSDQAGSQRIIYIGIGLEMISFLILLFAGFYLVALIAFVILVDLAQQMSHISNQTRVFSLQQDARSRLNTVYMFSSFMGAAFGSALGSYAWKEGRLVGICITAFLLLVVAMGLNTNIVTKPAAGRIRV